ncbi:MAG: hypothetical protein WCL02_05080 [bacterium]
MLIVDEKLVLESFHTNVLLCIAFAFCPPAKLLFQLIKLLCPHGIVEYDQFMVLPPHHSIDEPVLVLH